MKDEDRYDRGKHSSYLRYNGLWYELVKSSVPSLDLDELIEEIEKNENQ